MNARIIVTSLTIISSLSFRVFFCVLTREGKQYWLIPHGCYEYILLCIFWLRIFLSFYVRVGRWSLFCTFERDGLEFIIQLVGKSLNTFETQFLHLLTWGNNTYHTWTLWISGKCLESIQHTIRIQLNSVVLHLLCHMEYLFLSQS